MPDAIDWKARALASEAREATRASLGRPPAPPSTPDASLVANVCSRLSLSRTALAARLGVDGSILSRANRIPLAERHREALRSMMTEPRVTQTKTKNRPRQKSS